MQQVGPILHQDFPSGDQHSQNCEILAAPRLVIRARYVLATRLMGLLRAVARNGPTCVICGFSTKKMAEHALHCCAELDKR